MEGHPRYTDPGGTPGTGHVGSWVATRKRVFLLLDLERRSLMAHLRPRWRLRARYEDLSLVMMLIRLERDWLSPPRPHLEGGNHPNGHGDQAGQWLADWARPWGAGPWMKLDADLGRVDGALRRLGKWLPGRTVAKAKGRARQRLDAITTQVPERDPQARPEAEAAQDATKRPVPERPSRRPVTAIAGFFLLAAGAGGFLLASHTGSGPGHSASHRGTVEGLRLHPGALEVQIRRGSGQLTRGARKSANPSGRPGPQRSARERSRRAGQSAPVATEIAPPVPESVVVPQPAPAPAPPSPPAGTTSSQAKSAGGACPPEFGYEC